MSEPSPSEPPPPARDGPAVGARRCAIVVATLLDVPARSVVATRYGGGLFVSVDAALLAFSTQTLNEALLYIRTETMAGCRSVLAEAGSGGEAVVAIEVQHHDGLSGA